MRPVKLVLEGFTSFAARAEIDFEGLDLFAITGPTGAGKSSILDGILFALFGETSRRVSVAELRTQAAPAMKVQLEFACGERGFLVSRVYRGKSAVEFQLHEREGEKWKLLTAQAKQGGEEIERAVGLDFDGFTRAVILPQGAFDEFLRGNPERRTKILMDLLNLHLYQSMMQSANARAARLRDETGSLERQLETDYAGATPESRARIEEAVARLRRELESNRARQEELAPVRQRLIELVSAREQWQRMRAELEAARRTERDRAGQERETSLRMEEAVRRKADADAAMERTGFQPPVYEQLMEATPLARQIETLKSDLMERRARRKQAAAAQTASETAALAAMASLNAARQALQVGSHAEARRRYGSSDMAAGLAAGLIASSVDTTIEPTLKQALEQAERDLDHLRAADLRQHLKTGEPCPVCDQIVKKLPSGADANTAEAARKHLEDTRRQWNDYQLRLAGWSEKNRQAFALVGEVLDPAGALEVLASRLEQLEDAERKGDAARRDLDARAAESERLEGEIQTATDRLRAASAELVRYPDWNALPVEELEENLKRQRTAKTRLDELRRDGEEAAKAHVRALEASAQVRADLLFLAKSIEEKAVQTEAAARRVKEIEGQLGSWLTKEREVEPAARALMEEANTLRHALGQSETQLEILIAKLGRAAAIRSEIEAKSAAERRYRELGTLLNARNFIAYVQRQMLDRLAQLASSQLWTLSNNRYTLTLSHESNDFFVEDHWNAGAMRSARTLSGGESFLASLSLALALSGSVTGMAQQARLESLFLDEGFATLDAGSLQTAMEAIQLLASDRRMVGVISHLPQLAEQLPARLEVERSATGSVVRRHSHSMVAGGL